jgi:hypothetical protein
MRQKLGILALLVCGAGCRDSAYALARDYRNLNNEAIDAVMMINNEEQAKILITRVIKEYPIRLQGVDFRAKNWKQNNEKDDYGSQIYLADSTVILLVETEMNKERLELEVKRLKNLVEQMGGPAQCPEMAKLTDLKGPELSPIVSQLEKGGGDIAGILKEINNDEKLLKRGKMKAYKESFEKKYEEFKQSHMAKLNV